VDFWLKLQNCFYHWLNCGLGLAAWLGTLKPKLDEQFLSADKTKIAYFHLQIGSYSVISFSGMKHHLGPYA